MSKGEALMQERSEVYFPIKIPVRIGVGATGSKFLTELRDNKRIMGIRCPICNQVYMPPRANCPTCFSEMSEWVELTGQGTVTSYSIVFYSESYHPVESPIIYALIHLDGANTALPHVLNEVGLEDLKIGLRVQPVFRDERKGSILDITYFKPVD